MRSCEPPWNSYPFYAHFPIPSTSDNDKHKDHEDVVSRPPPAPLVARTPLRQRQTRRIERYSHPEETRPPHPEKELRPHRRTRIDSPQPPPKDNPEYGKSLSSRSLKEIKLTPLDHALSDEELLMICSQVNLSPKHEPNSHKKRSNLSSPRPRPITTISVQTPYQPPPSLPSASPPQPRSLLTFPPRIPKPILTKTSPEPPLNVQPTTSTLPTPAQISDQHIQKLPPL